jgi:Flp pilus assembly protein TadD
MMKRTRPAAAKVPAPGQNLDSLRQAAQTNPRDYVTVLHLAWALYAEREFAEAETSFSQCASLAPDDPEGSYGLGMALRAQSKREAAVAAFEEAARLAERLSDRTRAQMLHRLAIAHLHYLREGDWNLEKEVWRR